MSLTVKNAPNDEPITLDEAKAHLRIESDITDDDVQVATLITVAREWAERHVGRSYITRTYTLHVTAATAIELPKPPLQNVISVTSLDIDGTETALTVSDYRVNTLEAVPVVTITNLPSDAATVKVEYIAGYGDNPANCPPTHRQAMLLLIGHLHKHHEILGTVQEQEIPFSIGALLNPDKLNWGF
jgi:uncharacterized phiE125 gp8 family phage protein